MARKKADEVVIYHNPRCAKSREALKLLREHGVEPRIVEYLKQPPSQAELERLLRRRDLVRAMHEHPILIERPIVVRGERAVLGRPPERVLELLGG